MSLPSLTLVLGGARSGKSRFAEGLCRQSGLDLAYLATGRAWDDEMKARVAAHRASRGEGWKTVEEPLELARALRAQDSDGRVVIVDCLTLWITNLMMDDRDMPAEFRTLCETLPTLKSKIVMVSNEVGLGIVPENRMARDFRDQSGRLHQMVAEIADQVYFVAAGLPLKMKG